MAAVPATNHRIALGLGGNGPTTRDAFRDVVLTLREHPAIESISVSRLYGTAAIGRAETRFLNACILVEASLPLVEVLTIAKRLERDAGRQGDQSWGDRPLDVDVLLSDKLQIDEPDLVVPHRWLHVRRFVLDPLTDIWPNQVHPWFGRAVTSLRNHWRELPVLVFIGDGVPISASTVEGLFGGNAQIVTAHDAAHLVLLSGPANRTAWPPQIDLRDWPLTPKDAATAAIRGVIDGPEVLSDSNWAE